VVVFVGVGVLVGVTLLVGVIEPLGVGVGVGHTHCEDELLYMFVICN